MAEPYIPAPDLETACLYCDATYPIDPLAANQVAKCRCCGATLYHGKTDMSEALIYAVAGLICFICANGFPFLSITIAGEPATASIVSSVGTLATHGMYLLAMFVFFLIILFPALYLGGVIWVIQRARQGVITRLSRFVGFLSPWNMIEVYMLGVIVSLVKLYDIGSVTIQPGFWFFSVLIFCSIASSVRFDLQAITQQLYTNKAADEPSR